MRTSSLESKIARVQKKIPGIKKFFREQKTYGFCFDYGYYRKLKSHIFPQDLTYLETADFKVCVSKWKKYSDYYRPAHREWLEVHYQRKSSSSINNIQTDVVLTYDSEDGEPKWFFKHFGPFEKVGAEVTDKTANTLLAYWVGPKEKKPDYSDASVNKGPCYFVDLKRNFVIDNYYRQLDENK